MKRESGFLCGVCLGASCMYLFDPQQGKRRRALFRDQLVKGIHRVDTWVYGCFVDATQRARGLAAARDVGVRQPEYAQQRGVLRGV